MESKSPKCVADDDKTADNHEHEPRLKRCLRRRADKQKATHQTTVSVRGRPRLQNPPRKPIVWSCKEKRRLLEGLKTYGTENFKLISNLIGTKTETDVEIKITRLLGKVFQDMQTSDGSKQKEAAPIEKWIQTVNELVWCEETDYSQQITNILGYIAKHEKFEKSDVPGLSWSSIYSFLHKLAEGKSEELPELSEIESMILVEVMSDLGIALQDSQSSDQRQILETKFQLINNGVSVGCLSRRQKAYCSKLLGHALTNDISSLEEIFDEKNTHPFTLLETKRARSDMQTDSKEMISSQLNQNSTPDQSMPSCSSATSKACSSPQLFEAHGIMLPQQEIDKSQHVPARNVGGLDRILIKPKYFTLNPLCIPTDLLSFQRKSKLSSQK